MVTFSEFKHDYKKSIFNYKEPISKEYSVKLNGQEIPVYTCRISKYPFNRDWPGVQRSTDQTELASFVNIVSDEEIELEVSVKVEYERILIKPYSKGVEFTDDNGTVRLTLKENGHYVLQADSYHHTLYIFNNKPIAAPQACEVTHYFGPGVHMPGKITLKDNESVYVDKDALVFGCLYAEGAKNIRIFGNGLFDDAGEARFSGPCYEEFTNGNLKFYDCENVRIDGILLRDSAIWCVNVFHCNDFVINDVKVFGQWRYNTDGVDIVNSSNITVKNCFIHSFDDGVTIKGIDRYIESSNENILIEDCEVWCDWGRTLVVGVETACPRCRNITFRNCDVLRGGGVVLDVEDGNFAEISDILFENINVEYNPYDTNEIYQSTDDMVYPAQNQIIYPRLINVANEQIFDSAKYEVRKKELGYPESIIPKIEPYCVHDVAFRNVTVYYDDRLPKVDGEFRVCAKVKNYVEGSRFYNLVAENIKVQYKGEEYPLSFEL